MDLSTLQPIDPPKGEVEVSLEGLTPIGNVNEEKKNQDVEAVSNIETPATDIPPTGQNAVPTTTNKVDISSDWNNLVNEIDATKQKAKNTTPDERAEYRAEEVNTQRNVESLLSPNEVQQKAQKLADAKSIEDTKGFASIQESTAGDTKQIDLMAESKPETDNKPISVIEDEDLSVLKGEANPYPLATIDAVRYQTKELQRDNLKENATAWKEATGGDINDYFNYQQYYQNQLKESNIDLNDLDNMTPEDYDKFNQSVFQGYLKKDKVSLSGEDLSAVGTINENINYVFNNVLTGSLMGRGILWTKSAMDAAWKTGGEIIDNGINAEATTIGEAYRENIQKHQGYIAAYGDIPMATEVISMASVLAADIYAFGAMGGTAEGMTNAIWKGGARVAELVGIPQSISTSIGVNTVSKLIKGGIQMGLTLGQYNAASTYVDALGQKKISEIDWDVHKKALESSAEGMVAGMAAGTIAGVSNLIIQRTNAKIISKLYSIDATTGKMVINAGNVTNKIKAVSLIGNTISTLGEGAAFTVVGSGMRGDLDKLEWEDVVSESVKFLFAMRLQPNAIKSKMKEINSPYIIDRNFTPDKAFTGKYAVEFSPIERELLGAKDNADVIEKAKSEEWVSAVAKDKSVPTLTKLKLLAGNGIYTKKSYDIEKTEHTEINGEHYLISSDANGNLIDIRRTNSEAEAKKLEVFIYDINLSNKAIKSVDGLTAESVDIINAKYEANPESLLKLNEAFNKAPSQMTATERGAIREFNKAVESAKANDVKQSKILEPKPVEEVQPTDKTDLQTDTATVIVDGKEYQVETKEDGTHDITTTDAYGKDIPLRTAEGDNKAIEQKVIEEYDRQSDKTMLAATPKDKNIEMSSEQLVFKAKEVAATIKKSIESGKKIEATDIEAFAATVNDMMKENKFDDLAQKEVNQMFTALRKAESGVRSETRDKNRIKAINKISDIIKTAADKTFEKKIAKDAEVIIKTLTTVKQSKGKTEATTDTEYAKDTKDIVDASKLEPDEISNRISEKEKELDGATDPAEIDRLINDIINIETGQEIYNLEAIRSEFNATKDVNKRAELYQEWADRFEYYKNERMPAYQKGVENRREYLKDVTEKRKVSRENVINATKSPELKAKQEVQSNAAESFVTKPRGEVISEAKDSINNSEALSPRQKRRLLKDLDKLEKKNQSPEKDLKDLSKILKVERTATSDAVLKEKKNYNLINKKFAHYDDVEGLLYTITNDQAYAKEFKDFVQMTRDASTKKETLNHEKTKLLEELGRAIKTPDKGRDSKLKREVVGTEISNKFTVPQDKLGLEVTTKEGKSVSDFNEMSYSQILALDRALRNKTNQDILKKIYSEDSVIALQKHCADIISQSGSLTKASDIIGKIFDRAYEIQNEVYKEIHGTDLVRVDDYITRIVDVATNRDRVDNVQKKSLEPTSTINRRGARNLKIKLDIVDIIENHLNDAIDYNAYYKANDYWNKVLRNDKVKNSIRANTPNGAEVVKQLDKMYESYGVGMNKRQLPAWLQRSVLANLLFNTSLAAKQAVSVVNSYPVYLGLTSELYNNKFDLIPAVAEAKYLKDAFSTKNAKRFLDHVFNSPLVRERYFEGTLDPSMRVALETSIFGEKSSLIKKMKKADQLLRRLSASPMMAGDAVSILGIKPIYEVLLKENLKTMDMNVASEKAFNDSFAMGSKVLQSSRVENLSAFQLTSNLAKMIPYNSAPMLIGREMRTSLKKTFDKNLTPVQRMAAGKSFLFWAVGQRLLYKAISNAVKKDDDEEEKAKQTETLGIIAEVAASITQGIPLLTTTTEVLSEKMNKGKSYPVELSGTAAMMNDIATATINIVSNLQTDPRDWDEKQMKQFYDFAAEGGEAVTGWGIGNLIKLAKLGDKSEIDTPELGSGGLNKSKTVEKSESLNSSEPLKAD